MQKNCAALSLRLRHRFIPHLDRSGQAWRMAHLYTVFFNLPVSQQSGFAHLVPHLWLVWHLCPQKSAYTMCIIFSLIYTYINVWARAPSVGTSDGAREREREILMYMYVESYMKNTSWRLIHFFLRSAKKGQLLIGGAGWV